MKKDLEGKFIQGESILIDFAGNIRDFSNSDIKTLKDVSDYIKRLPKPSTSGFIKCILLEDILFSIFLRGYKVYRSLLNLSEIIWKRLFGG